MAYLYLLTSEEQGNMLKYVRSAPLYLSLITENAQNTRILQWYVLESIKKNPMGKVAFINEAAGCACAQSVCVCLWTVNTTLGLYALRSVGGPSEGRSPGFFSK